ncbi:conserved hypothetical protein [Paraburkholderia piptadeniae]|uniref:UPF0391 membrane protein BN2476_10069 n=1 Tax=Paraburkholderia piptadeniae TaxID=1701573 RepID=A0A1N7RIW8_9BURK|nr:conserved hypothetical protein [Paraburkholderia piptadeniae]
MSHQASYDGPMGTGVARCRDGGACVCRRGSRVSVDRCIDPSSKSNDGDCHASIRAIFFVIAIIAAIFGFGGIAAGAAEIAKVLFFIFVVIFLVTLLMGVIRR